MVYNKSIDSENNTFTDLAAIFKFEFMQEHRWIIQQKAHPLKVKKLSQELNNIPLTIAEVLVQRGIESFQQAKDFFRPDLSDLHNPFLMKGMEEAVQRILWAEKNNEKILVYGDYDVDGTTAVALMCSFLKHLSVDFDFYIPDRYSEGYGVSQAGVEFAHKEDFHLIIALDCGIKAHERVSWAKERNVDFIICDHHTPSASLPDAVAVLDPKRADCLYPFKELSGCGIGFKLCQALAKKKNLSESLVYDLLDLAAISIACDIVPIVGENRILAFHGLQALQESPRPGIKVLFPENFEQTITISDLVFIVGPRINAAGRIKHGRHAVELLLCQEEEAENLGEGLEEHNSNRKNLDRDITAEALQIIEEDELLKKAKSTVVFKENWHKGVIGIVASRLIESFYRPTVVLTEHDGKVSGSVRSVKGFDVYQALLKCENELIQFGGHKYAAGLTIEKTKIDAFRNRFEEVVSETILPEQLIPQLEIDAEVELQEINPKFYRILSQMAPFGPGNKKPVFISRSVTDDGKSKIVGSDKKHLKLSLNQNGFSIDAIAFNQAEYFEKIKSGEPFDIAYTIEENSWRGVFKLQLNVKAMKLTGEQ